MSLALSPGGCFCERLPNGGGIEHLRVSYIDPGKRIVLTRSLGPLLYEATAGVMDLQFERSAGGSKVTMDYKVGGFANGGAEKLAPLVDSVLGEQFKRYREYVRRPAGKRQNRSNVRKRNAGVSPSAGWSSRATSRQPPPERGSGILVSP